jgi:hypothetical protein
MKRNSNHNDPARIGLVITWHASTVVLAVFLAACGGKSSSPNMVPPETPSAVSIVPPATPIPPSSPASSPTGPVVSPPSLKMQIEELENQGKLPKLDRSASIVGPDVNANGVRDDIEAYIDTLVLTSAQKRAAMQKAKALQNTLTVDLTDKAALQKVGEGLMASTNCVGDIFVDKRGAPDSYLSSRIEAMTANTRERSKRYMEYNAARSGSVTSLPSGDTCDM